MAQFFKFTLATIVGLFLFFLLSFLILIGIVASTASSEEVVINKNSVLELKLDQPINERQPKDPFDELGIPFGVGSSGYGLDEIKASIRKAKKDDKIKGIFLNVEMVDAGMATLEEIRKELIDFKQSKKFIVAYNDICSEKAYYLISVADKMYINPQGAFELNGLSAETMFFKGMLEKLNIDVNIFKVGEFKSAVEPLFLDKMSEPNRLQVTSFLNSLNDYYLQNVAKSRNKTVADLKLISDSMLVHSPEDALKYGLVTNVGYYDEALDYIKKRSGLSENAKMTLVTLKKYRKVAGTSDSEYSKNRIAVIYASGDIVNGEGDDESIGGTKFANEIRKARKDKAIKAIVLRVNSPGGSAMASDVIWREVMLARKEKPVIASMSDYAASGGYYIAMACDTIVAHPNTITGSIGVFGIIPNFQGFLNDKLGITLDRVKTGKFSDLPTVTRRMTDFEKRIVQREVEKIYTDFTTKAAKGRDMTLAELQKIASGRVWSGVEAKERGLVDVLGGLEDAVKIAATRAKLGTNYRVKNLPAQRSFLEEWMGDVNKEVKIRSLRAELGEMYPYFEQLQKVSRLQGIQARLPFELKVQ
ncbi:signal peptide peptidase SppA [Adhaeribacter radiodurans]|uniref:Signal peptide peptidase SppA n=1 Tax=Adhaeribacter radiodurans TaxID=2745197 RepID=A0A7L7L4Q9_9BACT|nr:signal peptide peptidase SppA [Adhaeribacter radiodurans]QMU27792.1 signal peptide peptidase SppA [Adhaeribacter radiodurans]